MKQSIPLPKSSSSVTYDQLGYLESFDAVVDKLYAFLIYKETKTGNNKWVVRIKGSVTAGTVFDPENKSLENGIRKAQAHNEAYLVWGFNLIPKDNDPRLVENRLFFDQEGEPTRLEIHLITRDPDSNALPEKIISIDWPGAAGSTASTENDEFLSFYKQYEQACRIKDVDFFKKILPSDIPEDQFQYVLEFSQNMVNALTASGVKPRYEQKGNRMDVAYNGDLGDGMTEMIIDFYQHNGQWLKYNPEE